MSQISTFTGGDVYFGIGENIGWLLAFISCGRVQTLWKSWGLDIETTSLWSCSSRLRLDEAYSSFSSRGFAWLKEVKVNRQKRSCLRENLPWVEAAINERETRSCLCILKWKERGGRKKRKTWGEKWKSNWQVTSCINWLCRLRAGKLHNSSLLLVLAGR